MKRRKKKFLRRFIRTQTAIYFVQMANVENEMI